MKLKNSIKRKLKTVFSNPTLWIENFVKIPDKSGKLIPFKLHEQQLHFMNEKDKFNILIKSRQLGFSTLSLAICLYNVCTKSNIECLIVSYDLKSSDALFERLKIMYSTIPEIIKPKAINNNKKELKLENNSRIICTTAGNKDLGRGNTFSWIHLSEFAFWKDGSADRQLLALEQALSPNGTLVIESTPNGLNSLYDIYLKAKNGENLYKPFFFNWYDNKKMFSLEYENYYERYLNTYKKPLDITELDEQEKYLYKNGATIKQLIWRRYKIGNSSLEQFNQEFGSDDISCFITTSNAVFNAEKIIDKIKYLEKPKNVKLPETLKPYSYYLNIWEEPKEDKEYWFGVDVGEGVKQDYSIITCLDRDLNQCFEFASNNIAPHIFTNILYELAVLYNNAYLTIELASAGHIVVSKMFYDYNYLNLHRHKSYDQRGKKKKKKGFSTNNITRPILISDFREVFDNDLININSKELLEEMKIFQADKDGKIQGLKGNHDDRVMAMGICIQGLRSGKRYI